MAQLKDTTINGNLNVDGRIQIGNENVYEYLTFKKIWTADIQPGNSSIQANSIEDFFRIVLEYVASLAETYTSFVFNGIYDNVRYIGYITQYGTATSQALFMSSSYARMYRVSHHSGKITVRILDDFNSDYNIKSGDDLNNYTEEGLYFCPSQSIANTLINCPTGVAFRLEVKGTTSRYGASKYWQIIYSNAETEKHQRVWKRVYSPSGWSDWKKEFSWNDLQVVSGSKTTNSNGNVNVGLNPANYQIISASFVRSNGSTANCTVYSNGGTISVHVADNAGNPLPNETGAFRCVYLNI